MGRSLGDEEAVHERPSRPLVVWQVVCDWRDDRGRFYSHVGPLIADEREGWDAFHAEYVRPHQGTSVTIRLARLERHSTGETWGPPREIELWTPHDPVGPWTDLGRLRSDEPLVRRNMTDLLSKVARRPPRGGPA